ncbi:rhodanese-related sulfurtransferase [Synechococcus sp. 8F6]|uniref:oxygen-dependent tRNA uridine(34) hydroxylase TrhO n=1 Tax=Synechococcus sp. 8F6 TaxID=2025606 RepID=UPI000B987C3B|nr:rhodanese-related sulfurtransferase [Synechococcus sp. 8F6]
MSVLVAAFYRFAALEALPALRRELLQLGDAAGVRGTILLAGEGVNGTISGPDAGVQAVLQRLQQVAGLEQLQAKFSRAGEQAFHRLKVRLKREIVSLGQPEVQPYLASAVGTHVPPEQWDGLIADPDTLVIDTRNAYEVAIGTFAGAIDPGTESFREFPQWVERELRPLVAERQPKAIAMFCTGGIRCEKATAYLQQQGFAGVHHLQGGILRYLEEIPEQGSSWRGECFVFDQRVAVNHQLEPGEHSLCHACGLPLSPADRQLPSYVAGVSCRHCRDRFSDADRARFAERQRQMERARGRGERHLGERQLREGQLGERSGG